MCKRWISATASEAAADRDEYLADLEDGCEAATCSPPSALVLCFFGTLYVGFVLAIVALAGYHH